MENPRPEKVAAVAEVRERIESSDAVLLTEYRGLDVTGMAELRRALREAGGEYKIYKNTFVRFAARDLGLEIEDLLTGPTAIAFVPRDGGDPVDVAKALKGFAKGHPELVVKGGLLGDRYLSAEETSALADVAPREELLARLAGGLAAPMQSFAGLLQAMPQNLAYALAALIAQGGAPGAPADDPAPDDAADAEPAPDPASDAAPDPGEAAEADTTPTSAADAADDPDNAPAAEAPTEES